VVARLDRLGFVESVDRQIRAQGGHFLLAGVSTQGVGCKEVRVSKPTVYEGNKIPEITDERLHVGNVSRSRLPTCRGRWRRKNDRPASVDRLRDDALRWLRV
jgi:hypothetical protein